MIYERIKALCKERGVSIHALEVTLGLGNGVISGWKTSSPRVDNLQLVADYFDVKVDYFMRP